MTQRQAYFCGEWIAEADLRIAVDDLGFAMGITATERLRTFGGRIFRLDDHMQRMRNSLESIGLDAGAIGPELAEAIAEYRERHANQILDGDDWAIVAFVTPGSGNGPTTAVHGMPLPFAGWADEFTSGVPVYTSSHRQVPPNCWPAELKCRSRMHYYLADQEAHRRNPRARAILLDQLGFVGEASTANLVVYSSSHGLRTPCFDRVLPGVSVAVVEELARQLEIPFSQGDMTPDELLEADEVWLSSTSICILPVVECDDQPVGSGCPGPVYGRFLAQWGQLVGLDIAGQAMRFANRLPDRPE